MKYLVTKRKRGKEYLYWQPKARYKVNGVWVDCPLAPRPIKSINDAQQLNEQLGQWRKGQVLSKMVADGSIDWLIGKFKASQRFKKMWPSTQKMYLSHFKEISREMGDIPIDKLSMAAAYNFCTSFTKNPRKPSAIASSGRVLYGFARFIHIKYENMNPFRALGISKPAPRKAVWLREDEEKLRIAGAKYDMQAELDAAIIAMYSAQRPQDIRVAAVNHYDGKWWRITQQKTGAVVEIPVYRIPQLKEVLNRLVSDMQSPVMLIHKGTGKPFSKDMLCRKFRDLCNYAGLGTNLQFRDFRRTAIVRLGEAGCTSIEIASWSGHEIESVDKILKVYLPRNRTMADNAGKKASKLKVKKLELAPVHIKK